MRGIPILTPFEAQVNGLSKLNRPETGTFVLVPYKPEANEKHQFLQEPEIIVKTESKDSG